MQSERTGSDDIVVTAQRTESLASKTPIALSAIKGDALLLGGTSNPTVLGDVVPNLAIVRDNGLQITIRGVSSRDQTEKGDPSAALLLDGVYIARPKVQEVSFFDIDRVEVLRGPQGTLYGRNTTAGVINIISKRPTDRFEGSFSASYGNFDTRQAEAAINVPVGDWVSLRFSGAYDYRDSYVIEKQGDRFRLDPFKNNLSGRIQSLVKLGADAELLIKADYSSIKGSTLTVPFATPFFDTSVPAGQPAYTDPRYIGGGSSARERRQLGYSLAADPRADSHTWGVSGELTWDFGPLAMTYLGSLRKFREEEDYTIFTFGKSVASEVRTHNSSNSQELRFASTGGGPFKVQFGGYYFREKTDLGLVLLNGVPGIPYFGILQDPVISESAGAFGQATYSLTPALRFTVGARYSHDDKSRKGASVFQQTPTFNPATDQRTANYARIKSSKVTWRAGLDYDLTTRTLLYGSLATGYKAGGFNDGCEAGTFIDGVPCANPQPRDKLYYKPETLTAYEVGIKTRFADDVVRMNASAFYYDYKNIQVSGLVDVNGLPRQLVTNAAKARIRGVELETTITPDTRNRFDAAFSWLDAEYLSYSPQGVGQAPDYAGRPLDHAPKIVVSAGYTYTYPFRNGSTLAFSARTRLSDSYVMSAFGPPRQFTQPSYTKTDLDLTFRSPDDRWFVQGFAKNLENDVIVTSARVVSGVATVSIGDPRTYGVRVGMKF